MKVLHLDVRDAELQLFSRSPCPTGKALGLDYFSVNKWRSAGRILNAQDVIQCVEFVDAKVM
jgi:hypothetical protein